MALTPSDADKGDPPIWAEYRRIIDSHQANVRLSQVERFEFYAKTRDAYAVVATGETALYANIILQKGIVIQGHGVRLNKVLLANGTSGIQPVDAQSASDPYYYSIDGRRTTSPTRGLYIHNGQKMVIKK